MTTSETGSSAPSSEASEIETPTGESALAELGLALEKAFADIKCLRCGNETFFLASPAQYVYEGGNAYADDARLRCYGGPTIETVNLICKRCGMIESHALNILRDFATKALPEGTNGE